MDGKGREGIRKGRGEGERQACNLCLVGRAEGSGKQQEFKAEAFQNLPRSLAGEPMQIQGHPREAERKNLEGAACIQMNK